MSEVRNRRFAVARMSFDGEHSITLVEAESEAFAVLELVPVWYSGLEPPELSMVVAEVASAAVDGGIDAVIDYFASCDESVAVVEVGA